MLIDVPDYELETIQHALANYANYWEEKASRSDFGRDRASYALIAERADQIKRKWEGKHLPVPALVASPTAIAPRVLPTPPSGGLKVVSAPSLPRLPPTPARAALYALQASQAKPLGRNFGDADIDF